MREDAFEGFHRFLIEELTRKISIPAATSRMIQYFAGGQPILLYGLTVGSRELLRPLLDSGGPDEIRFRKQIAIKNQTIKNFLSFLYDHIALKKISGVLENSLKLAREFDTAWEKGMLYSWIWAKLVLSISQKSSSLFWAVSAFYYKFGCLQCQSWKRWFKVEAYSYK